MQEDNALAVIENELIPARVWSGFYSAEEILEEVLEFLVESVYQDADDADDDESEEPEESQEIAVEEVEVERLRQVIEQQFNQKRQSEATWPKLTDCDRLSAAFAELTQRGIVSLENAGYTISDGWSDWDETITNDWHAKGRLNEVRGGCFYHGQDLERAVQGAGLNIAFSAISGEDADGLAIGREIVEVLEKHDFKPTWNCSISERIFVPIVWQKR